MLCLMWNITKHPGQMGSLLTFIRINWDVIKIDLMNMFAQLHSGDLPLFKIIFRVITLFEQNRIKQACLAVKFQF